MSSATTGKPPRPGSLRRRARLWAASASLVTGLVAAAVPLTAGGAPARGQLLLAAPAVVALLAALLGWTPGFTIAGIAIGAEYAWRLAPRHRLDALAVVEAVALFATIELGLRSLEARTRARPEPAVRRAAWWTLVAMLGGAGTSAFVVLALGSRRLPAPTAGLALGLAAAAAVLFAAELLRRQAMRTESRHEH